MHFSITTSVKLDEGEGVRDGDRDAVVVVVLLTVADTERVGVVALEGRSDADELADGVTTFTPHTARLSEMSTTLLPGRSASSTPTDVNCRVPLSHVDTTVLAGIVEM